MRVTIGTSTRATMRAIAFTAAITNVAVTAVQTPPPAKAARAPVRAATRAIRNMAPRQPDWRWVRFRDGNVIVPVDWSTIALVTKFGGVTTLTTESGAQPPGQPLDDRQSHDREQSDLIINSLKADRAWMEAKGVKFPVAVNATPADVFFRIDDVVTFTDQNEITDFPGHVIVKKSYLVALSGLIKSSYSLYVEDKARIEQIALRSWQSGSPNR